METGFRAGEDGKVLPRNIIQTFSCRYNGELVFSAELFSAVSANPYIAFHTVATDSGTLVLSWEGDNGFSQAESIQLAVTAWCRQAATNRVPLATLGMLASRKF